MAIRWKLNLIVFYNAQYVFQYNGPNQHHSKLKQENKIDSESAVGHFSLVCIWDSFCQILLHVLLQNII